MGHMETEDAGSVIECEEAGFALEALRDSARGGKSCPMPRGNSIEAYLQWYEAHWSERATMLRGLYDREKAVATDQARILYSALQTGGSPSAESADASWWDYHHAYQQSCRRGYLYYTALGRADTSARLQRGEDADVFWLDLPRLEAEIERQMQHAQNLKASIAGGSETVEAHRAYRRTANTWHYLRGVLDALGDVRCASEDDVWGEVLRGGGFVASSHAPVSRALF